MRLDPITPQTSISLEQEEGAMLLATPGMARTLTAGSDRETAGGGDGPPAAGPYGTEQDDVPDLSETSEPDGARASDSDGDGAAKAPAGSASADDVAQNNTVGEAGATARRASGGGDGPEPPPSDGPSTGPSTPTGNWLEPQQLDRDRWVSEDAAFGDPGAWGGGDDSGALVGDNAPPTLRDPPMPASPLAALPALQLISVRSHSLSEAPDARPRGTSPPSVARIQADAAPVTAPADAKPLQPVLIPPHAPSALGEAAAHALTLPGRPGARPAQQESNGHQRRTRSPSPAATPDSSALRADGRSPAHQERRHSLPDMPFVNVRLLDSVAEVRVVNQDVRHRYPLLSSRKIAGRSQVGLFTEALVTPSHLYLWFCFALHAPCRLL